MAPATHPDPCGARCETADALNRVRNALADAMNEAARIRAGAALGNADRFQVVEAVDLGRDALALAAILGAVPAAATDADPSLITDSREAA
ncbi:hypothetical protein [Methylorubrum extorquens]|uniref:hypothetical protein n=1 Tax=Methylorubrum extorquens TaxID=408 RepID=UPI002238CDA0|nr:hypothetical protein [Methylorubrum extorquens]UYW34288.1 hypothetical protein OKB92_09480 [Methylorubrum extorquens]